MTITAPAATRSGRFQHDRGGPHDLLVALAGHAQRQVGGEAAAVCSWPRGDARGPVSRASTSDDRRWQTQLAGLVAENAASTAAAAVRAIHGHQLAVVRFATERQRALLAVSKPEGLPFSPDELALLDDVAGLARIALASPAPGADGAEPPSVDRAPEPPAPPAPSSGVDFHHRLPLAFERLEALPALAQSRDVLLGVLDDPNPESAAIVAAIESDIALLIAVLRLANRANGGARPVIWSVPDAVEILTPEGVETLARRITVFDFFQRIRGWAVPPEHFRLHAIKTQRAAQQLARLVDHPHPDQLLTAALLHDVGKLVLLEAFSTYPDEVLQGAETPEQRLLAERRTLGLDHQMAGGVLLRRWRLPKRLAEIVSRHHDPGEDRDAALIGLADSIAHYAQGRPVSPSLLPAAAASIGVSATELRTVMYELSQPAADSRPRAVERSPLSRRETDILRQLATGQTYKEIALNVGLSPSTVRSHLHSVYKKLEVADRAQAVMTASARGWI